MRLFDINNTFTTIFGYPLSYVVQAPVMLTTVGRFSWKTTDMFKQNVTNRANQQSIDVSSLPKGLYYMIIKNTNGSLHHTTAFQKVNKI